MTMVKAASIANGLHHGKTEEELMEGVLAAVQEGREFLTRLLYADHRGGVK